MEQSKEQAQDQQAEQTVTVSAGLLERLEQALSQATQQATAGSKVNPEAPSGVEVFDALSALSTETQAKAEQDARYNAAAEGVGSILRRSREAKGWSRKETEGKLSGKLTQSKIAGAEAYRPASAEEIKLLLDVYGVAIPSSRPVVEEEATAERGGRK